MPSLLPISWANSPQTHCDWIQGAQFLKECVSVVFIFIGHDSRQNHFSEICFWLHVWYEEKEREWSGHSSDPRSAIQNDTRMQLEFEHAPHMSGDIEGFVLWVPSPVIGQQRSRDLNTGLWLAEPRVRALPLVSSHKDHNTPTWCRPRQLWRLLWNVNSLTQNMLKRDQWFCVKHF